MRVKPGNAAGAGTQTHSLGPPLGVRSPFPATAVAGRMPWLGPIPVAVRSTMNHRGPSLSSSRHTESRQPEAPDPFRFGWRYLRKKRADGREVSVQVPLTLDDVLHPREGDHIPEN